MQRKVIINRGDTDIRVAFLEDNKLAEFHQENITERSIVGNIYRGVVQDVVQGLQAAFVDVGLERNVFLHFMDVRPEALVMLAPDLDAALTEASQKVMPGRIVSKGRRPRPDIHAHDVEAPLKKGDTIIVQIVKEGINDKAPRVTTNLAIAGRYLVLLPFPGQSGGVSRRIAMGQDRIKLKKLLHDLKTEQYSFIMRTAGLGAEEDQVRSDVEMLREQWVSTVNSFRTSKKPGLVYSDHDIVLRLVRDAFTARLDEVVVDDHEIAEGLRATLSRQLPELVDSVHEYDENEPIFHYYGVEPQIHKAIHRKVWLKSGGYIIVDETEALTAIDVNTGRYTGSRDLEKTAFRTNMEACETVAQQIRLRDIGGIIVVDFIDMLSRDHQNQVCEEFRRSMRHDRAKSTIGRIGDFGLLMLTRKRKHMSLQKSVFDHCPYCEGEGFVLNARETWRRMQADIHSIIGTSDGKFGAVIITCQPEMADNLNGEFRDFVDTTADQYDVDIAIRSDIEFHRDDYKITPVERPTRAVPRMPRRRVAEEEVVTQSVKYESVPELMNPEFERTPAIAKVIAATPAAGKPAAQSGGAAEARAEQEDGQRKRTRRGRRGGRRRRERIEQVAGQQNGAPISQNASPPSALEPAFAFSELAEIEAEETNPSFHDLDTSEEEVTPEVAAVAAAPARAEVKQIAAPKPAPVPVAPPQRKSTIQVVSRFGPGPRPAGQGPTPAQNPPVVSKPVVPARPAQPAAPVVAPAASQKPVTPSGDQPRKRAVQIVGSWGTPKKPDATPAPAPIPAQAKAPVVLPTPTPTITQPAAVAGAPEVAAVAKQHTDGRPPRRPRPPRTGAAAAVEPAVIEQVVKPAVIEVPAPKPTPTPVEPAAAAPTPAAPAPRERRSPRPARKHLPEAPPPVLEEVAFAPAHTTPEKPARKKASPKAAAAKKPTPVSTPEPKPAKKSAAKAEKPVKKAAAKSASKSSKPAAKKAAGRVAKK